MLVVSCASRVCAHRIDVARREKGPLFPLQSRILAIRNSMPLYGDFQPPGSLNPSFRLLSFLVVI
jgi:hypothetical protein